MFLKLKERWGLWRARYFSWTELYNRAKQAEGETRAVELQLMQAKLEIESWKHTCDEHQAAKYDALPAAEKLLRMVDEIAMRQIIRGGEIRMYEVRSWRDDYLQYRLHKGTYRGRG